MKTIVTFILLLLVLLLSACAPMVTNQHDKASNIAISANQAECVEKMFNGITDPRDRMMMLAMIQLGGKNPCEMSNSYDYATVVAQEQTKQVQAVGSTAGSIATGGFVYLGFKEVTGMAIEGFRSAGDRHTVGGDMIGRDKFDTDISLSDMFNSDGESLFLD